MKHTLTIIVSLTLAAFAGCESSSIDVAPPTVSRQIVAFQATWCGACQRDKPTLAQIEKSVPVTRIDSDAHPEMVQQYGITALPTYILYRDGQEIGRTSQIQELQQWLSATNGVASAHPEPRQTARFSQVP